MVRRGADAGHTPAPYSNRQFVLFAAFRNWPAPAIMKISGPYAQQIKRGACGRAPFISGNANIHFRFVNAPHAHAENREIGIL
ncbi:hypothetical protein [Burkholderia glumae]|uniref:hypothetical protein n=1 Tax=Burkholderia glumae TaxID=337 RepID=UPI000A672CAD|nr:hypothetical protein [Burkholderia glumae]